MEKKKCGLCRTEKEIIQFMRNDICIRCEKFEDDHLMDIESSEW